MFLLFTWVNMDNLEQNQADEYCRACLYKFDSQKDVASSKTHAIFPNLVQKFVACTNANASENDEFSNFLCDCCYHKLIAFHMFQTMCLASLERFHALLLIKREQSEANLLIKPVENIYNRKQGSLTNSSRKAKALLKKYTKTARKSYRLQYKHNSPKIEEVVVKEAQQHKKDEAIVVQKNIKNVNKKLYKKSGKLYLCDICQMRFLVEHRLTAHKRAHSGLIPYPCPRENCERGFKRWHCLNEHLKQHEGTNDWFACEEEGCKRRYKHRTTLDMHMRRYHKKGRELKTFVCEICGKVFKSSAILNDHRFTHKEKSELPFACDQPDCKHRFSNREKLKIHLLRHAGIKNFECPHCGMKKTTRNELKIHINYHTLERRFPYRFCKQVCNSAGNLKVHIRTIHERARDYACRFCDRSFAKPDTRKYHEMTHTGEKPHQCTECGKKFVQPAALRTHKKIHQRQKSQGNISLESTVDDNEQQPKSSVPIDVNVL